MNAETGTEAAQFPKKKYIDGIFVAVCNAELEVGRGGRRGQSSCLRICRK
jgi:hypothetical protein